MVTGILAWVMLSQVDAGSAPRPPRPQPLTQTTVVKVMTAARPQVQACYEDLLAQSGKATPKGTVVTGFTVTPEGSVKGARVERKGTTLKDAKLHNCVISVLAGLEFPPSNDGKETPITYPFNLTPVN